jgi:hypothetical protein
MRNSLRFIDLGETGRYPGVVAGFMVIVESVLPTMF